MKRETSLDPELVRLSERAIAPEEFERRLRAITEEEIAENLALITWFVRRYPTARERLRYVSRKHKQWTRKPRSIRAIAHPTE